MTSRVKQGLTCLFSKYDKKNDEIVRRILSWEEFLIFDKMGEYDKVHGMKILGAVQKDELLSKEKNFQKLALLHDCGKGEVTIFRRVKKVLIGDALLESHAQRGYELLKEIDLELAKLCREHHTLGKDPKMARFQEIDDR